MKIYANYVSALFFTFSAIQSTIGQVEFYPNLSDPNSPAILDVQSNDKGVLIPRMSSLQRSSISNLEKGLLVFDISTNSFWFYNGTVWEDLSEPRPTQQITDDDNDTKVQVEKNPDEDIIRFELAGTEQWIMKSNRMESSNSGNSIFIGQDAGLKDDLSNNRNLYLGPFAGQENISGQLNLAIGLNALTSNQSASSNTALGHFSLSQNLAGANVAVGRSAFEQNTSGFNNVGVGTNVGSLNQEGGRNVLLGFRAGEGGVLHNKSDNVMVGALAGQFNEANGNVFIGSRSAQNETGANKLYIENSNSNLPLIYGEFDNDLVRINGTLDINDAYALPTSDGLAGQVLRSAGTGVVSWEHMDTLNLIQDMDGDTKIQVEESADEDLIRFDVGGTEKWKMKDDRLEPAGSSTHLGKEAAMSSGSDEQNVLLGFKAGENLTAGFANTVVGSQAFTNGNGSQHNTALGFASLQDGIGQLNTAVGASSLENNTGSNNVALGYGAGRNSTGDYNVFIGYLAGDTVNGTNQLIIQNGDSGIPLIEGSFATRFVQINGDLISSEILAKDDSGLKFRTDDNLLTLRIRDNGDIEPYQRIISGKESGLELFAQDQTANITLADNDSIQLNGNIRLGHQGSLLTNVIKHVENIDLPSISGDGNHSEFITVTGATTDATVMVSPEGSIPSDIVIAFARVSAADTVQIRWNNVTSGSQNPNAMNYRIIVVNH